MPAVPLVPREALALDDGVRRPHGVRVAVQHRLDLRQQAFGRPLRDAERVLAQLPGEVLVVGTDPALEREHHVEPPVHRLGRIEAAFEGATVAVGLERAVGHVDVAVELVAIEQHPPGLVDRVRRLAPYGRGDPAAGVVAEHLGVGEPPAIAVVPAPPHRHVLEVGHVLGDLVDRRGLDRLSTRLLLVGEHHEDVDVGGVGGHPAGCAAGQHEPEDGRVVAREHLVQRGLRLRIEAHRPRLRGCWRAVRSLPRL